MTATGLVLASASPRRAALLREAGIVFEIDAADVDETPLPHEAPIDYVKRLAEAKAMAVAARRPGRLVLGADTTVVLDDEVLGKPRDPGEAAEMLRRLSGRSHRVLTGICLVGVEGRAETSVASTTVEFLPLDANQIAEYVATGEPMDKAGAYAIQGGARLFVRSLDGELANVIGLPISVVTELLRGV